MLSIREYEALTWDIFDLSDAELAEHLKHVTAVSDGEPWHVWTAKEKEMYVLSHFSSVQLLLVLSLSFDL